MALPQLNGALYTDLVLCLFGVLGDVSEPGSVQRFGLGSTEYRNADHHLVAGAPKV